MTFLEHFPELSRKLQKLVLQIRVACRHTAQPRVGVFVDGGTPPIAGSAEE